MAQTAQESFDVLLGAIATGEWRHIGHRRQPRLCLCLADLVEQDDRVELHKLRRKRVL